MKTAEALVELYKDFYELRIKHLGSKSWRSLRYFFKTMSLQKEYLDILETEHEYQKEMYSWLCDYIDRNEISSQQINSASTTFHMFRAELQGRNLFLIIFMVFLGLTGSLYKFLSSHLGTEIMTIVLILNWVFGVLAVWERTSVAVHVTIANQLQVLLDRWLDERP
jgi:hypothetical protein